MSENKKLHWKLTLLDWDDSSSPIPMVAEQAYRDEIVTRTPFPEIDGENYDFSSLSSKTNNRNPGTGL